MTTTLPAAQPTRLVHLKRQGQTGSLTPVDPVAKMAARDLAQPLAQPLDRAQGDRLCQRILALLHATIITLDLPLPSVPDPDLTIARQARQHVAQDLLAAVGARLQRLASATWTEAPAPNHDAIQRLHQETARLRDSLTGDREAMSTLFATALLSNATRQRLQALARGVNQVRSQLGFSTSDRLGDDWDAGGDHLDALSGEGDRLFRDDFAAPSTSPFAANPQLQTQLEAALELERTQQYAAASEQYQAILAAAPQAGEIWFNQGNVLTKCQRYAEAQTAYQHATEWCPTLSAAWFNLGNTCVRLNQPAAATVAYRRALDLDAHNPNLWFNHGNALAIQGKYADAVGAYSRAIELRPGFEAAIANRHDAAVRARDAVVVDHLQTQQQVKLF
jgi:tetratricopeptide (TPR) repeat protein